MTWFNIFGLWGSCYCEIPSDSVCVRWCCLFVVACWLLFCVFLVGLGWLTVVSLILRAISWILIVLRRRKKRSFSEFWSWKMVHRSSIGRYGTTFLYSGVSRSSQRRNLFSFWSNFKPNFLRERIDSLMILLSLRRFFPKNGQDVQTSWHDK